MGFVEETGVAQHFRDSRIAPIYEGTNGIQAADLVGRKLPMRAGQVVLEQLDEVAAVAKQLLGVAELEAAGEQLEAGVVAARRSTEWLLQAGARDPNDALGASTPYLRLLGTVVCGGLLSQLALAVMATGDGDEHAARYRAKVVSAKFFAEQIVPGVVGMESVITAGSGDLFALTADQLA
jgi:acyl-CoA dehydrogenase